MQLQNILYYNKLLKFVLHQIFAKVIIGFVKIMVEFIIY